MSEKMREEFEAEYKKAYGCDDECFELFDGHYFDPDYDDAYFFWSVAWEAALRTHENGGQESEAGAVGWRRMDSAPKDGSEFVVRYTLQGNAKRLVSWNTIHGFWQSKGESVNMAGCEWHPIEFAPPSARAIETAAIIKCADLMVERGVLSRDGTDYQALLALIPQDGRTQLRELMIESAENAFKERAMVELFGNVSREKKDALIALYVDRILAENGLIGVPPLSSESVSGEK